MKDKSFVIKVWDLLQEAGRTDEIQFSHKWTEQLPGLTDDGITGIVSLQSLSRDSVYVDLDNVECAIDSICDTCETPFVRDVHIDHYGGKFVLWEENMKLEQEHTEEEIFAINARDEGIDIEDMVVQAILLDAPIVNHCASCAKKIEELPDDNDDNEYFNANNVVIH